jgi:3-hydroxyacyl-[acyl-carrier-protein] dehydratase
MRFLLLDRVLELEPGRRVIGCKAVSLTEEYLRGHDDRPPAMPGSLVLESMLQVAAWPAIVQHDYAWSLVLSVVEGVRVAADVAPGSTLRLYGEVLATNRRGTAARAHAEVDGERVAWAGRILYAHLPTPDPAALRDALRRHGGRP